MSECDIRDRLGEAERRIATLEKERDNLLAAIGGHVTVRGDYYAELLLLKADQQRLDETIAAFMQEPGAGLRPYIVEEAVKRWKQARSLTLESGEE